MNLTLSLLRGVLTGRLPAYTLVNYVLICLRIHPAFPYIDAGLHAIVGGIAFSLFYDLHRFSVAEHLRDMRAVAAESAEESLMEAIREVEEEFARAVELYQDCRTPLRQRLQISIRFANAETKIRQISPRLPLPYLSAYTRRKSFTKPERILEFFEAM